MTCPLCNNPDDELDDGYCHGCQVDLYDDEGVTLLSEKIAELREGRVINSIRAWDVGCTDWEMHPNADSVWITIDTISVYVRRTDEGVAVSLYPKGREMDDELAGTWALFTEGELDENDHPPDTE